MTTSGLPLETLEARVIDVRDVPATWRRLQSSAIVPVVEVDASLSADTPTNPASGETGITAVTTDLLQVGGRGRRGDERDGQLQRCS